MFDNKIGLTLLAVAAKTILFTVWKLITCQYLQLKNMVRRLFVCFPCLTAVLCCAVLCCAVLCCAALPMGSSQLTAEEDGPHKTYVHLQT